VEEAIKAKDPAGITEENDHSKNNIGATDARIPIQALVARDVKLTK